MLHANSSSKTHNACNQSNKPDSARHTVMCPQKSVVSDVQKCVKH